jgi:hypothetical protein
MNAIKVLAEVSGTTFANSIRQEFGKRERIRIVRKTGERVLADVVTSESKLEKILRSRKTAYLFGLIDGMILLAFIQFLMR